MSSQSDAIPRLFEKRMQAISAIAKENSEMLRLLQQLSGQEILTMKDPDSQVATDGRTATEADVAECKARIGALESELSRIDEEIEAAQKKEE